MMETARITMAIDLKKHRLRVHKPTLRLLGFPPRVFLLFSPRRKAILILKCEETVPEGYGVEVVYDKPDSTGTFDIYCKELINRIRKEFGGLEQTGLYRLQGFPISEGGGVLFPLSTLARAEDAHVPDPA